MKNKYRVWDKKHSVMLEPIELEKLLKYLLFQSMPNSDAYGMMKDHFEDLVWLQSTGLKDKNGVEIYAADVVKSEEWNPNIYQVGFDRGGFCFFSDDSDFANDAKYLEDFEVIGNIYENPELLETK